MTTPHAQIHHKEEIQDGEAGDAVGDKDEITFTDSSGTVYVASVKQYDGDSILSIADNETNEEESLINTELINSELDAETILGKLEDDVSGDPTDAEPSAETSTDDTGRAELSIDCSRNNVNVNHTGNQNVEESANTASEPTSLTIVCEPCRSVQTMQEQSDVTNEFKRSTLTCVPTQGTDEVNNQSNYSTDIPIQQISGKTDGIDRDDAVLHCSQAQTTLKESDSKKSDTLDEIAPPENVPDTVVNKSESGIEKIDDAVERSEAIITNTVLLEPQRLDEELEIDMTNEQPDVKATTNDLDKKVTETTGHLNEVNVNTSEAGIKVEADTICDSSSVKLETGGISFRTRAKPPVQLVHPHVYKRPAPILLPVTSELETTADITLGPVTSSCAPFQYRPSSILHSRSTLSSAVTEIPQPIVHLPGECLGTTTVASVHPIQYSVQGSKHMVPQSISTQGNQTLGQSNEPNAMKQNGSMTERKYMPVLVKSQSPSPTKLHDLKPVIDNGPPPLFPISAPPVISVHSYVSGTDFTPTELPPDITKDTYTDTDSKPDHNETLESINNASDNIYDTGETDDIDDDEIRQQMEELDREIKRKQKEQEEMRRKKLELLQKARLVKTELKNTCTDDKETKATFDKVKEETDNNATMLSVKPSEEISEDSKDSVNTSIEPLSTNEPRPSNFDRMLKCLDDEKVDGSVHNSILKIEEDDSASLVSDQDEAEMPSDNIIHEALDLTSIQSYSKTEVQIKDTETKQLEVSEKDEHAYDNELTEIEYIFNSYIDDESGEMVSDIVHNLISEAKENVASKCITSTTNDDTPPKRVANNDKVLKQQNCFTEIRDTKTHDPLHLKKFDVNSKQTDEVHYMMVSSDLVERSSEIKCTSISPDVLLDLSYTKKNDAGKLVDKPPLNKADSQTIVEDYTMNDSDNESDCGENKLVIDLTDGNERHELGNKHKKLPLITKNVDCVGENNENKNSNRQNEVMGICAISDEAQDLSYHSRKKHDVKETIEIPKVSSMTENCTKEDEITNSDADKTNKLLQELQKEAIRKIEQKEKEMNLLKQRQENKTFKNNVVRSDGEPAKTLGVNSESTRGYKRQRDDNHENPTDRNARKNDFHIPRRAHVRSPVRKGKLIKLRNAHQQIINTRLILAQMRKEHIPTPSYIEQSAPYFKRCKMTLTSANDLQKSKSEPQISSIPFAHSQKPFGIAGQLIIRKKKKRRIPYAKVHHKPLPFNSLPNTPSTSPVKSVSESSPDHHRKRYNSLSNIEIPEYTDSVVTNKDVATNSPVRAHRFFTFPTEISKVSTTSYMYPPTRETGKSSVDLRNDIIDLTMSSCIDTNINMTDVEHTIQTEINEAMAKRQKFEPDFTSRSDDRKLTENQQLGNRHRKPRDRRRLRPVSAEEIEYHKRINDISGMAIGLMNSQSLQDAGNIQRRNRTKSTPLRSKQQLTGNQTTELSHVPTSYFGADDSRRLVAQMNQVQQEQTYTHGLPMPVQQYHPNVDQITDPVMPQIVQQNAQQIPVDAGGNVQLVNQNMSPQLENKSFYRNQVQQFDSQPQAMPLSPQYQKTHQVVENPHMPQPHVPMIQKISPPLQPPLPLQNQHQFLRPQSYSLHRPSAPQNFQPQTQPYNNSFQSQVHPQMDQANNTNIHHRQQGLPQPQFTTQLPRQQPSGMLQVQTGCNPYHQQQQLQSPQRHFQQNLHPTMHQQQHHMLSPLQSPREQQQSSAPMQSPVPLQSQLPDQQTFTQSQQSQVLQRVPEAYPQQQTIQTPHLGQRMQTIPPPVSPVQNQFQIQTQNQLHDQPKRVQQYQQRNVSQPYMSRLPQSRPRLEQRQELVRAQGQRQRLSQTNQLPRKPRPQHTLQPPHKAQQVHVYNPEYKSGLSPLTPTRSNQPNSAVPVVNPSSVSNRSQQPIQPTQGLPVNPPLPNPQQLQMDQVRAQHIKHLQRGGPSSSWSGVPSQPNSSPLYQQAQLLEPKDPVLAAQANIQNIIQQRNNGDYRQQVPYPQCQATDNGLMSYNTVQSSNLTNPQLSTINQPNRYYLQNPLNAEITATAPAQENMIKTRQIFHPSSQIPAISPECYTANQQMQHLPQSPIAATLSTVTPNLSPLSDNRVNNMSEGTGNNSKTSSDINTPQNSRMPRGQSDGVTLVHSQMPGCKDFQTDNSMTASTQFRNILPKVTTSQERNNVSLPLRTIVSQTMTQISKPPSTIVTTAEVANHTNGSIQADSDSVANNAPITIEDIDDTKDNVITKTTDKSDSATGDISEDMAHMQQVHGRCILCGKYSLYLCSSCKKIWYCSPECQLRHWQTHAFECEGQAGVQHVTR